MSADFDKMMQADADCVTLDYNMRIFGIGTNLTTGNRESLLWYFRFIMIKYEYHFSQRQGCTENKS